MARPQCDPLVNDKPTHTQLLLEDHMLCHETHIPGFHHDSPYELLEAMKEKKISLLWLQEDKRGGGWSHCQ